MLSQKVPKRALFSCSFTKHTFRVCLRYGVFLFSAHIPAIHYKETSTNVNQALHDSDFALVFDNERGLIKHLIMNRIRGEKV